MTRHFFGGRLAVSVTWYACSGWRRFVPVDVMVWRRRVLAVPPSPGDGEVA